MVLAFPGTRGLFIHMKEAFRNTKIKIVDITKGIRVSLSDIQCLSYELVKRHILMYELVPLLPTLDENYYK